MHFGGWLLLLLAGLAVFAQEPTTETSGEPTQNVPAVTEASVESTKTTIAESEDNGDDGETTAETSGETTQNVPAVIEASVEATKTTIAESEDNGDDGETTVTTTTSEDGGESTSGPTTDSTTSETDTENTFASSSTTAGDTPPTETSVQTTETATKSITSDLTTKDLETSTIEDDYDFYSNITIGNVQNATDADNGTLIDDIKYDNDYYFNYNDTLEEETEDPTSPSFRTSLVAAISTLVIVALM